MAMTLWLIGYLNGFLSRDLSVRFQFWLRHVGVTTMRTVDPEEWYKTVIKPKSILGSFTCRPKSKTFESLLKDSFVDAMKEFWANSSIGSLRYFQISSNNKLIRNLYNFVLAASLICAATITAVTFKMALDSPPVTISPIYSQRSLKHIDFPAVALCSYNLISRTALHEYSTYLNSRDGNRTYSLADIQHNLLNFGALSDIRSADVDVRFARFLAEMGDEWNITEIMLKLSPRCASMLVRCTWRFQVVPCEQLFAVRLTRHGFCCAFNSRYELEDRNTPPKRVDAVGEESGLGVVVRENTDDIAYMRRPTNGIEVLIWAGNEFPVSGGGVVTSLPANRNSSVFIKLRARVQHADQSLHYVSENWRQCRMPKPQHASVAERSFAWCLLQCREAAVRALCECSPHTMHVLHSTRDPPTVCSLDHLSCLNKHREMLLHHSGNFGGSTPMDFEGALHCGCLPDCARTQYFTRLTQIPYNYIDKLARSTLSSDISLVNTTIIHVYYTKYEQEVLLAATSKQWYGIADNETVGQILSQCDITPAKMCSHWVFVVGALLPVLCELSFHCTVRWRRNFVRRRDALATSRRLWENLANSPQLNPAHPPLHARRVISTDAVYTTNEFEVE